LDFFIEELYVIFVEVSGLFEVFFVEVCEDFVVQYCSFYVILIDILCVGGVCGIVV